MVYNMWYMNGEFWKLYNVTPQTPGRIQQADPPILRLELVWVDYRTLRRIYKLL